MNPPISNETLAFIVEGQHFAAVPCPTDTTYQVIDVTGYAHATCEDKEAAVAVAESLNAVANIRG